MQVGVVRMRPSLRRTETLPSQATMYSRWYIHRPTLQISRRYCFSLFWFPANTESGFKVRTPFARHYPPREFFCNYLFFAFPPWPEQRNAFFRLTRLSVDSPHLEGFCNTVDGDHVSRDAVIDLVLFSIFY